jgi:hypothetical protein
MFFPGSRYLNSGTYTVTRADGATVSVVAIPLPVQAPLRGYHRRVEGHRLDLIAWRYLADATAFWRLCDANNALAPDALATRDLIGIPAQGS